MVNAATLRLVKQWEGLRLTAYLCPAGVWTIGYGHTDGVKPGDRCTEMEAESWLTEDLLEAERTIGYLVRVPLTENQRGALASFVFNVGGGAFGRSTLLKKLNAGDYSAVPGELKKWNKAGGKELAGLTGRRKAEGVLWGRGPLVVFCTEKPADEMYRTTMRLQRILKDLGLYDGVVDGWPGRETSDGLYVLLGCYLDGDPRKTEGE